MADEAGRSKITKGRIVNACEQGDRLSGGRGRWYNAQRIIFLSKALFNMVRLDNSMLITVKG